MSGGGSSFSQPSYGGGYGYQPQGYNPQSNYMFMGGQNYQPQSYQNYQPQSYQQAPQFQTRDMTSSIAPTYGADGDSSSPGAGIPRAPGDPLGYGPQGMQAPQSQMPPGMGMRMMFSQMPNYMTQPPGQGPPPPPQGAPPPGQNPAPAPTPAPYTPPPSPYTPPPVQTSPTDPNGILGGNINPGNSMWQGGTQSGQPALMAAQTAMFMGGPYGPKTPPPGGGMYGDGSYGWNQASQAWEKMK